MTIEQLNGRPGDLSDLMRGSWAIPVSIFDDYQRLYASYAQSPKLDIAGFEKRTGIKLAPARENYRVDRGVALIEMDGALMPKENIFTRIFGGTSTQWVTSQVKAAVRDSEVKAIVLAIDSSGGTVTGTSELASVIFDATQHKPVVTHSDGILASAAYWIGAAASGVYISGPTVHVGSIGVVKTRTYDPDNTKITTDIFAGRYKQYTSGSGPTTKEMMAYMQEQVDCIYTIFIDAVAGYRGVTPSHVATHMAEGRIFIGQQAVDAGLVDSIISLKALVNDLAVNPSAHSKRRRIGGHRVVAPSSQAAHSYPRLIPRPFIPPKVLTAQEQADAAVAYSKQHGVSVVQALKTLAFAT